MAAAGKVCTGFSKPFVAKYLCEDGRTVHFSDGRPLARGVKVSISPNTGSDNIFYADNAAAESEDGVFTGGTVKLTVDGLLADAERFVYGLPEPAEVAGGSGSKSLMTKHGVTAKPPYLGIGVVVRYQSAGTVTYVPMILVKTKFKTAGTEAATQEESKNWQTQDLEATIFRDDTEDASWKWVGEDLTSESEAARVIKNIFGITED